MWQKQVLVHIYSYHVDTTRTEMNGTHITWCQITWLERMAIGFFSHCCCSCWLQLNNLTDIKCFQRIWLQKDLNVGPDTVQHGISTGPDSVHHHMSAGPDVVQVLEAAVWKEHRFQSPRTKQTSLVSLQPSTLKKTTQDSAVNTSTTIWWTYLPLHSLALFLLASLGLTDQSETLYTKQPNQSWRDGRCDGGGSSWLGVQPWQE